MAARSFGVARARLAGLFFYSFPVPAVVTYVVAVAVGYLFVAGHMPLALYTVASHDDGLFLTLGESLARGEWLGPFGEHTLMKGPGYPLFLAASYWLGLPVTLAAPLFNCFAILVFVWVAYRLIGSQIVAGAMLALMLWHPGPMTGAMLRILRDTIYHGQTLLVFALLVYALFLARTTGRRVVAALLGGVALGWFWLTREEGVWIVPAVGVLVLAAGLMALRQRRLPQVAGTLVALGLAFGACQVGFSTMNMLHYGKFVGVDVKEANFVRALGALQSVRTGGTKPLVSVTKETMRAIGRVSPTFRLLLPSLDVPQDQSWARVTCQNQPESCGEIGAGWFIWALRGAAAVRGQYGTPSRASVFFGLLGDEILAACNDGRLECEPQPVATMPPFTLAQLGEKFPALYRQAFDLLLYRGPPAVLYPSYGAMDLLAPHLAFLNNPVYVPSPEMSSAALTYTISGWYHASGDEWPTISVRTAEGEPAKFQVDRVASADIAKATGDPEADQQRFLIYTFCPPSCILRFETPRGEALERALGNFENRTAFPLSDAHLQIEGVAVSGESAPVLGVADEAARAVRLVVLAVYEYFAIPFYVLGLIAFVVTLLFHFRSAFRNLSFILALSFWLLALARVTLLALISATSFNAMGGGYFVPTYYMVIAAAGFSIAAWLQCFTGWLPTDLDALEWARRRSMRSQRAVAPLGAAATR